MPKLSIPRRHAARRIRRRFGNVLAQLSPGDTFEVLELAGGNAWGVARGPGLVGYIDAGALGDAA
jgi:hypothetical protein